MNKIIIAFLLLGGLSSCRKDGYFPCIRGKGIKTTEVRAVAEFSKIDYRLPGDVEVVKGDKFEVAVSGYENQLPETRTRVSGDRLIIDSDRCLKNTDFHVLVTLPHLSSLSTSGSVHAEVREGFDDDNMEFSISGSGSITAPVISQHIRAKISGSGDIRLSGVADKLIAEINGSGKIKAFGMEVKQLEAQISGSGNVESSVSERIDAQISGSGTVSYKGSPGTVNSNISGSGKVVKVN